MFNLFSILITRGVGAWYVGARFVDYAGDTVPVVVDRLTGETRPAWIFVAVLGASAFTYAEATQGPGDWIGAHTGAFAAMSFYMQRIPDDDAAIALSLIH
jgi:transposase